MPNSRAWARGRALVAAACLLASFHVHADPQALERARSLLAAGNAKQAYEELRKLEGTLTGQPEFDYLLGVSALDSARNDEAIIAFERVLALIPNHAGAQMDLARAYYAAGSYDLAEAAFIKLRGSNPPPAAQQAIQRYLDAIQARKHQAQAGWVGFGELGLGYDTNITGVPTDFGAAAQQAFNLVGIEATGNSIKRRAPFAQGGVGAEYARPLGGGWGLFAGGEARGRAYRGEPDFSSITGEARFGGVLNAGANQVRATASYFTFEQDGAAPGEPRITNDRRMASAGLDWRRALDTRTQVGLAVQANRVTFPTNEIEDFDQIFMTLSYLKSFDRKGAPLLYLTTFGSYDRAPNEFADGTTKSKALAGVRSYVQVGLGPKVQVFNGLALVHRRDRDEFARSTQVQNGRDTFGELTLGALWQFRDRCNLRLQYAFSTNRSNIDIYDFNRHEISSTIRCDLG
ncbi:MAG TPA: tetratricopeptide repeat protein [Usitatibacter sp.]|nr:tetratricopeptide repeat protein [Usitatibacter sp.]